MAGLKNGPITLVKDKAPQVMWMHRMLHRESVVAKEISAELSDVMDSVVKAVNFVKTSALQTHLLREKNTLLYITILRFDGFHAEQCCHACWSSARYLGVFTSPELAANFSDDVWVTKLAYLAAEQT